MTSWALYFSFSLSLYLHSSSTHPAWYNGVLLHCVKSISRRRESPWPFTYTMKRLLLSIWYMKIRWRVYWCPREEFSFEWHNDLNVRKLNMHIVKYVMKIYKYWDKYFLLATKMNSFHLKQHKTNKNICHLQRPSRLWSRNTGCRFPKTKQNRNINDVIFFLSKSLLWGPLNNRPVMAFWFTCFLYYGFYARQNPYQLIYFLRK